MSKGDFLQNSECYQKALAKLPTGVIITDLNDIIQFVNEHAQKLTGYSKEEMIGEKSSKLLLSDENQRQFLKRLSTHKNDEPYSYLIEHVRKDGTIFIGRSDGTPLTNEKGKIIGTISTLNDLSKHEIIEKKVQKLTQNFNYVNNEFKEFTYIISHDLKAPIRAISSLIKWLVEDYQDKFDEMGKEQLDLISDRVDRLNNLLNGTLTYSRVVNRMEKKTTFQPLNLLKKIANDKRKDHILLQIAGPMPMIYGEREKIGMVLENLISNAIQHTSPPDQKIEVGYHADKIRRSYFYVKDNGRGIEEKHIERIFKIFQSIDTTENDKKVGIGLTIAKKIVEMHGGKMWVESQVGEGSKFCFTLPLVQD